MPVPINPHEKYKLSEKEIQLYGDIIIEDYTAGIKPMAKPIAIILGGQPGAGKSELTTAALNLTGKNAVICNADEYRDYHPKSSEIKKFYEQEYPDITVQYSQPWNNRLRQFCEEKHYNFILETTFSSGDLMNRTITEIKNKGYDVYLMVISVNKQISFLGTRIRYEDMKAMYGFGRLVNKAIHDEKYQNVLQTLKVVQDAKLYDRLYIYGRAGRQKIKGMHNGLVLISENSEQPFSDYQKERDKEWSDNDLRFFNNDILYLLRMMIARKATYKEMQDVLDVFGVGRNHERS